MEAGFKDEKICGLGDSELKELLPPMSDLPFVEARRIAMVKRHMLEIAGEDALPHTRSSHVVYLRHLGAEAVLEYLPEK